MDVPDVCIAKWSNREWYLFTKVAHREYKVKNITTGCNFQAFYDLERHAGSYTQIIDLVPALQNISKKL